VRRIQEETEKVNRSIGLLTQKKQEVDEDAFDWKDIGKRSGEVLDLIQENDPVVLKNAYRSIFTEIVIGDLEVGGIGFFSFYFTPF
jgi:hypothetical protein